MFMAAHQSLAAPLPKMHERRSNKFRASLACTFGPARHRDKIGAHQREARPVDLTLRMDLLAVCAVFVFVGAVLIGAF
jgi:hypothetical protein